MDTESVRLRDGDAGLQNPSRSLDKHGKIHENPSYMHIRQALKRESR